MKRASGAAWWITPSLLCLAVYWLGLEAWFRADDFAWLGLASGVHSLADVPRALFMPQAQGTIRPWSERAFFLALYSLFGMDALPYRICVFLTQFANIALLASIARRLTGSAAAGWWTAVFWVVNSSQGQVMSWNSTYNQALCALFLLGAFHCLLRYCETGRRAYWIAQWVIFLLGFGALELNMVYPALASGYTLLFARRYFRGTLPLFLPSLAFVVVHKIAAPLPSSGVYVPHFEIGSLFRTLLTYWSWTVGPTWLETPLEVPSWFLPACVVVVSAALLAVVVYNSLRRRWLPLFCLFWFLIVIAPLLPFRDHITEYYPFLPSIGLAILGGWAFAAAWRRSVAWKAAATAVAAVYVVASLPSARMVTHWTWEHSILARKIVFGVVRARQLHPGQIILLEDVDGEVFWNAIVDHPFRIFGISGVYVAPGTEDRVGVHPDWGDPQEFLLSPDAVAFGLESNQIVVYSVTGERLRNITSVYPATFRAHYKPSLPQRVDVANPLLVSLLGPTWYRIEDNNHRWMPAEATVRLRGPQAPGQQLHLVGACVKGLTADGPVPVTVQVDGIPLRPVELLREDSFDISLPLPDSLVGKASVAIFIKVGRTRRAPGDIRDLSLAFGIFEIR
jgi:hypothetical protein